jgi:hypothetical protein
MVKGNCFASWTIELLPRNVTAAVGELVDVGECLASGAGFRSHLIGTGVGIVITCQPHCHYVYWMEPVAKPRTPSTGPPIALPVRRTCSSRHEPVRLHVHLSGDPRP